MNKFSTSFFLRCSIPMIVLLFSAIGLTLRYKEYFHNYRLKPYNYVYTGNDPLYFYNYNRYRKPYRWPFRYYSSYPYSHLRPYN